VTQTLSDGQHINLTSAPQVTAFLNGAIVWQGTVTPSVNRNSGTGVSTLDFALGSALAAAHVGTIDSVQITDRTVIETVYAHQGSGMLTQGDVLTNTATLRGGSNTGSVPGSITLPTSSAVLTIVGVNGAAVSGPAHAAIGDAVTYQALITVPLTSARAFTVTATGPGPAGATVFNSGATGLSGVGHAQFGPSGAGGGTYTATIPAVTVDGSGALTFSFGTIQPAFGSGTGTISLRYTTILQSPTNPAVPIARLSISEQNNTGVTTVATAASAAFTLDRPSLSLQMASLYVSDNNAVFAGSGGPFGFSPFTSQFGGVISSAGLAAEPFQDSLTNVAAGDLVTFVVTVENTAVHAAAYGIMLRDTIPAGFVIPPAGTNISVTDGGGTPLNFTGDLFDPSGGLMLDPSVAVPGYDPNSGDNIVLLTFSLQASDTVPVTGMALNPVATLVQVAAGPGGQAVIFPAGVTTTTTVTTGTPSVTATRTATGPLGLGDLVTVDVTVTLIPGTVPDLRIDDLLSPSLSLISAHVISTGSGLTLNAPVTAGSSLDFGTVLDNSDGTTPSVERFTVEYVARASARDPAATWTATVSGAPSVPGGPRWSAAAHDTVTVVAPVLTLHVASPSSAQAGQTVPVTVTLANAPGSAAAFQVGLTTAMPGLTLVPGSIVASGTRVATQVTATGALAPEIDAGETLTVTYLAQLSPAAAQTVTATAAITGTSLSGFTLPGQSASTAIAVTGPAVSASVDIRQPKIGDVVTLRLTVVVPPGSSPDLRLVNLLPPGLSYLAGSASVVDATGVTGTLPAPTVSAPTVSRSGQTVTLDEGAVTASGPGQIVLSLQAVVSNLAVFGPVQDLVTVTTGFSGSGSTTVPLTIIDTPPILTGLAAITSTADTIPVAPFIGLHITDPDQAGQQQQTVTVRPDTVGNGTLSGFTAGTFDPSSGTYTITGTALGVTAALDALTFIPGRHLSPVNVPVVTHFTVTDTDAAGGVTAAVTAVAAVTSNSPPALSGVWAQQLTTTDIAISPFGGLALTDPDTGQGGTLTIQLSDPTDGTLSGFPVGAYDAASGRYSATGQLPDLQAAARSLVFNPARAGTAQFSVSLDDGAGGLVSDVSTMVSIAPSADITASAQHFASSPTTAFLVASNGSQTLARGEVYLGPVRTLQSQFIYDAGGSSVIVSQTPNSFIKSFSGFDAIQLSTGTNVVDAGPGSNFLVGGTGADTFFLDGTHGAIAWDTIVGFHPGDMATLFGFHAGISTFTWADNQGAAGYTGRTLHADLTGAGLTTASVTFSGTNAADTAHFAVTTGTVGGIDYLAIINPV